MTSRPAPERILAVKLADVGDLLLITPALRALRQAYPAAGLDVLAPPRSAAALDNLTRSAYQQHGADVSSSQPGHQLPLIDELLVFDKYLFDHPVDALRPGRWGDLFRFARQLRSRHYDTVILFHHLSLPFGALKHAALMLATGARRRIGLDNGRGWFLTHRVRDGGFGVQHELDYWLALAAEAGAQPVGREVEIGLTGVDRAAAAEWLPLLDWPTVALHPGSGGYSLARRWAIASFAELGRRFSGQARVVLVGTPADGAVELAARLADQTVDLGGKTALAQLAAVLARCDLVIGADSGVLHVAAAIGTPVVALFGPSNHRAWAPALPPDKLTVIRVGCACSPCAYTSSGLGAPTGCPERTCMARIEVDRVYQAATALLAGRSHKAVPVDVGGMADRPAAVDILGVPLHKITFDSLLDWLDRLIAGGRGHQIATVNPEFVMAARRDPIFQVILERATLCLPDGIGLLWASRWLADPLPERVTGSDGVPLIAARAAERGWRLFLLGAAPGVAERTADILRARYPGLAIAGTWAGSPAADEEAAIVELVNRSEADILFVAYGAPKQDKWIARNLPHLRVGVAMGVGGAFDFVSGQAVRAPHWMRRLGLEWLHRLIREPWRWRRMLALPRFAWAVFWLGLRRRIGSRADANE